MSESYGLSQSHRNRRPRMRLRGPRDCGFLIASHRIAGYNRRANRLRPRTVTPGYSQTSRVARPLSAHPGLYVRISQPTCVLTSASRNGTGQLSINAVNRTCRVLVRQMSDYPTNRDLAELTRHVNPVGGFSTELARPPSSPGKRLDST
jgi:hypothetical protein